ncbi:MAG: hypothetical protein SAJ72_07030 [Jaaginema sp. PMC 1080.18]|nr:hypothetical protein [Jaaginema sp. PMC 1080.18]
MFHKNLSSKDRNQCSRFSQLPSFPPPPGYSQPLGHSSAIAQLQIFPLGRWQLLDLS